MDAHRALVALHILFGIVLTGQALFWFIMNVALRRDHDVAGTLGLLRIAQSARWPHVAVPWSLRLPLPWMGWATLAVLVASGYVLLQQRGAPPTGFAWHLKMGACGGLVLCQALMQRRPLAPLANVYLLLSLAVMACAAQSIR